MHLRNDKVLIFGGGSGIGKAIAVRFLAAGADVMIAGRTESKLQEAAEEISSPNLYTSVFDITDIGRHREFFAACETAMGGLTAFVNAAAMGTGVLTGRGYEPWDITEEEWDTLTNTNFKAAYFLMRNEIDYMLKTNIKGNILNIASNAACMDIVGSYGASKEAIIKWTRSFGKRYGHNGIIINGIAPGATFTPMISSYAQDINQKYDRHAIERFIRPDEIAELAFYLMSNYGEIICGHTVIADGGDNNATL
jgi:NAD(P)-dependent dehydrogenase (short-subunit alcohol dehydrogenase family)